MSLVLVDRPPREGTPERPLALNCLCLAYHAYANYSNEKLQIGSRARNSSAGTGAPPASFSGGLLSGNPLCSGLEGMATEAQWLQVFHSVIFLGKRNNTVH